MKRGVMKKVISEFFILGMCKEKNIIINKNVK